MKRDRKATPCMCLPLEWAPLFASLSDGKAGMLVKALMRHAEGGLTDKTDRPDETDGAEGEAAAREVRDPSVRALLMVMIPQIDAGMAKQAARMEASRKANAAKMSANDGQSGQDGQDGRRAENTERSPNGHRTVTERSPNGHRTVTERAQTVPRPISPPALPFSTHPLSSPVGEKRSVAPCAPRTHARKRLAHWIGYCLGKFYHRRKTTAWSEKETAELRKVSARPDAWSELRTIAKAYCGGYEYRRHDIITLLRNWSTELDRAAAYNQRKEIEHEQRDDVSARYF